MRAICFFKKREAGLKLSAFYRITLLFCLIIFTASCGKKAAVKNQETGTFVLSAATSPGDRTYLDNIPVGGGKVFIQSVWINIQRIEIEEIRNNDAGNGAGNGGIPDDGEPDVVSHGPFLLDLSSGASFLDSIKVFPGQLEKLHMVFKINPSDPFDGKSIIVQGQYISADKTINVPFTLKSEFTENVLCRIQSAPIQFSPERPVNGEVVFDVGRWIKNVDFSDVQVVNKQLQIDNHHNKNVMSGFEANIVNAIWLKY